LNFCYGDVSGLEQKRLAFQAFLVTCGRQLSCVNIVGKYVDIGFRAEPVFVCGQRSAGVIPVMAEILVIKAIDDRKWIVNLSLFIVDFSLFIP
jgi:hypothetical protein